MSREFAADLGRKAERREDYVRLSRNDEWDHEPERPRIERPRWLNLAKADFQDVLCIKATKKEHAGVLELKGIRLLLRWSRYHKRIVMLIDAKAAWAAVAKGRTGSPLFRPTFCSINALLLASDTLLRPVYIPSEDNPADAPSHG